MIITSRMSKPLKLGTALENNPSEPIEDLLKSWGMLDDPYDLIESMTMLEMEIEEKKQILKWMEGIYNDKNVV